MSESLRGSGATAVRLTDPVDMVTFVDEGLGNSSYLVDIGAGRALVVDPTRDPRPYLDAASARGLRIAYAAETHLHADFVSGSRELAAGGGTILGSAAGQRAFPHHGLSGGEEVDLGGLTLRALATPGHTPEHLAFLLLDGTSPVALFSGGSLLVGGVARTDLTGPERTRELARELHRSLRDSILVLPDDLRVYPTHGSGSFCSAPTGMERTTTIGRERAANPLLASTDEDEFVARLLGGLGSFPAYFHRLPKVNRLGPRVYGEPPALGPLPATEVRRLIGAGAEIVDVRRYHDFAAGHIPGAVSIQLRAVFESWLGWLVEPTTPLVFVVGDDQDRGDLVGRALKVGYENLAGELEGGMRAWRSAGYTESRIDLVTVGSLPDTPLIDVRQAGDFDSGHIPGSVSVELGSVAGARALPDGPVTLTCGHGEKAMSAASILERRGWTGLAVLDGGVGAWSSAPGNRLVAGR